MTGVLSQKLYTRARYAPRVYKASVPPRILVSFAGRSLDTKAYQYLILSYIVSLPLLD
jgi:hypothetical protein